jgi:hypothetical protein
MIQLSIQAILTAVFALFAGPIAEAITPGGWYGLGAGLAGFTSILAVLFHPETKYYRPRNAYQETGPYDKQDSKLNEAAIVVCTKKPDLDFVNFQARTWQYELKLWHGRPEWEKGFRTFVVRATTQMKYAPKRS